MKLTDYKNIILSVAKFKFSSELEPGMLCVWPSTGSEVSLEAIDSAAVLMGAKGVLISFESSDEYVSGLGLDPGASSCIKFKL